MKYSKKLYYADFASARLVRPKNRFMRILTDTVFALWYLILFLAVCAFYPTALFADGVRFMKLQYLRLSNENLRKGLYQDLSRLSIGNWRNIISG